MSTGPATSGRLELNCSEWTMGYLLADNLIEIPNAMYDLGIYEISLFLYKDSRYRVIDTIPHIFVK